MAFSSKLVSPLCSTYSEVVPRLPTLTVGSHSPETRRVVFADFLLNASDQLYREGR